MNAEESVNLSSREIWERSLKRVWKKIWPDLNQILCSTDEDEIVKEIVKLAMRAGWGEFVVEKVEDIMVQGTAASQISNDALKEIPEQKELLKSLASVMNQWKSKVEGISKARWGVIYAISIYE